MVLSAIDERLARFAGWLRGRLGFSRRTFVVVAIAYLAFIWLLSSSRPPGPELVRARALKYVVELLYDAAHLPLFAGLAFAWILALGTRKDGLHATSGVRAAAMALTVAYGVVDEVHQSYTPGRSPSPFDVTNDGIAAVIAIVFVTRLYAPTGEPQPRRALRQIACLVALGFVVAAIDLHFGDAFDAWWRQFIPKP
jgi:VanZ family protein